MKVELEKYSNKRICVAVSGGKDSMTLLHYLHANGAAHGITLCALNCDHGLRGEQSKADSAFVKSYCEKLGVPLVSYVRDGVNCADEASARIWRIKCYANAIRPQTLNSGIIWRGADCVATAHHMGDNAETVLFNLARGAGMDGATGISDTKLSLFSQNGEVLELIRPLICVTRAEIDEYIRENNIPYVTDSTNLTDDYTRNKLRHRVLPELESAIPEAQRAIFRFSRLAAKTENYFDALIERESIISGIYGGKLIKFTPEEAVFSRAVLKVFEYFQLKDYTSAQIDRLYSMQFGENGKRFEFLGLCAYKESGGLAICSARLLSYRDEGMPFELATAHFQTRAYMGELMIITSESEIEEELAEIENACELKILKFDFDRIPKNAVIRFKRDGDKFTKFGGGTKSLGDYFTDKKIPARLRGKIPLVAVGSEVLIVGGVEISDGVKLTQNTKNVYALACKNYIKI